MPALSLLHVRARALVVALLLSMSVVPAVVLVQPPRAEAASVTGQQVVDRAAQEYGKPYTWGATGPNTFDCSGFTGYIFRQFGINLPRVSRDQYAAIPHIPTGQQQLGDLIFTYDSGGIYHVGIYAGNNVMWAATHTGDIVRQQTMWSRSYYVGRPAGLGAGPAAVSTTPISQHWSALGGAAGILGGPLTGELTTPNRAGQYTHYQGGSIYATASTGPREVHGAIRDTWAQQGWEASSLGFPATDEVSLARGGRFNQFQGGSIYWAPGLGAHDVRGEIRTSWGRLGWENSALGYPVTGELPDARGGRFNHFQNGSIYWTRALGAHEVRGVIRATWAGLGWEQSSLGYPTTDERALPDGSGRYSDFQHGRITWTAATGRVVVTSA